MTPSIQDLFAAPQMAALHILDSALDATINALTAAHADPLWEDESGFQITFEQKTATRVIDAARDIIDLAEDLREAITGYGPDLTPPWEDRQLPLSFADGKGLPF